MKQLQKFAAPLVLVMVSPFMAVGAFAQKAASDATPASHAPAKLTGDEHEQRNFS